MSVSRREILDDDHDDNCCGLKSTLKSCILWMAAFIASLSLCIVTSVVIFGPHENDLSPRDMIFVTDKLSSVFCEGVRIEPKYLNGQSVSERFTAYLVDHEPVIDNSSKIVYNQSNNYHMKAHDYSFNRFYFLRGSTVKLHTCTDESVEMFVIPGADNFNKFVKDSFQCDGCYIASFPYSRNCRDVQTYVTYELAVHVSDYYYFVFVSLNTDAWISTKFHIERTVYVTNRTLNRCINGKNCHFVFNDLLKMYGVVIQRTGSESGDNIVNFETHCKMRVWVYVVLFVLVPFLISIVGSCFIFIYSPRRTVHRLIHSHFQSALSGRYGTVPGLHVPGLPKYEEVAKLPTYQEAFNKS